MQIWQKLIKLQFKNGDISDLKELEGGINIDELNQILKDLADQKLIYLLHEAQFTNSKYRVSDLKSLQKDYSIKGLTVPEKIFKGEQLLNYLQAAKSALGDLIANTAALKGPNPPGINVELAKEYSRINGMLTNIQQELIPDTLEVKTYDDKDSDRTKLHFEISKKNGNKITFLIQLSGTWLAVNREIDIEKIKDHFKNIIQQYIASYFFKLPYHWYTLRCICAKSPHTEDGIVVGSFEELGQLSIEDLLYKREV